MPRQTTEASTYLEMYKLVNERTKLQHELEWLNQRREDNQKRLEVLHVQIAATEKVPISYGIVK